jgi:hypothetical protein
MIGAGACKEPQPEEHGTWLPGRAVSGATIKYPLSRQAHFPEWLLRKKLYLDFSAEKEPRYQVPDFAPVPDHRLRPALPELTVL